MGVKTAFLNGNLEEEIYMDLSKHLGHGISDLIKQSSHLVLNKILMNHVCTKDIKIK